MSTALSHLWPERGEMLSGSTAQYNYADLLEECFGPARALDIEGLDELFEAVEKLLGEENGSIPTRGDDSFLL